VGSRLKLFKKGKHYIVDVEILKRALRELVEREPSFLRDLMLDALRSDGGAAEVLLELLTRHPEAKLKLAQVVAGSIAVPLNVATKDDIKATKQDLEELKRWAEEKFATKEDSQAIRHQARPRDGGGATKSRDKAHRGHYGDEGGHKAY
jgi:hypothetical protein